MSQFNSLAIKEVRRETPECVSILFDVPASLADHYRFQPGQNVTLRLNINGEEMRRSYSICSSPFDNELRIAVKLQEGGKFSAYANLQMKVGDVIDVLSPAGRFSTKTDPSESRSYLAFAAGSGITPVISILKSVLAAEPDSFFTLVYGNRNRTSIIFREELHALKNRYIDRFAIHHVLSREATDAPLNHGRIDAAKCSQLSEYLVDIINMDHIFLCGPREMIFSVRDWLLAYGIRRERIHYELFTVPGEQQRMPAAQPGETMKQNSSVRIKLDGIALDFQLPFDGPSILEGALARGADLPYSCKGGVCATCRAKLLKGEVEMDNNYALEPEELDAGFILTCQSHPRTAQVEIDFDMK